MKQDGARIGCILDNLETANRGRSDLIGWLGTGKDLILCAVCFTFCTCPGRQRRVVMQKSVTGERGNRPMKAQRKSCLIGDARDGRQVTRSDSAAVSPLLHYESQDVTTLAFISYSTLHLNAQSLQMTPRTQELAVVASGPPAMDHLLTGVDSAHDCEGRRSPKRQNNCSFLCRDSIQAPGLTSEVKAGHHPAPYRTSPPVRRRRGACQLVAALKTD